MTEAEAPAADDLPARVDAATRDALGHLVELLAAEPSAPSTVVDPATAWRVHIADSLSGLEIPGLREAGTICDVGSGAGFPGLPLALALPEAHVDLLEATGRKCGFLERAIAACGAPSARVVCERAEGWAVGDGRELYGAVTSRAVGRLATVAELASPLLREGGCLVVWKGHRDPGEEAEALRAVGQTAVEPVEVHAVAPYAGSRNRHLHVLRKAGPTPAGLPRRPGMAKKRPFGAERNPKARGNAESTG